MDGQLLRIKMFVENGWLHGNSWCGHFCHFNSLVRTVVWALVQRFVTNHLSLFLWRNENFVLKFMIRIVHVETCKGIFLMLVQLYLRLCMMHNLCDNLYSMDYKFIKWHVFDAQITRTTLIILYKIYSRNRLQCRLYTKATLKLRPCSIY